LSKTCPLKRFCSGNPGFTLLEVLVSVILLSIVLAGVYAAYTANIAAIRIAQYNSRLNQTARIVFQQMTRDLESAFVSIPYVATTANLGMRHTDRSIEGRPADVLDFTALSHLSLSPEFPSTDLCRIGYDLDRDSRGAGLILYRRDDGFAGNNFQQGADRIELARRVTGLDYVFQDDRGMVHDSWSAETDGILPTLIVIKLHLADPNGQEHLFMTSVHPALAPLME